MSNLTVTKGLYYYNNMKENGGKGKQGGKKEKRVSKPKKKTNYGKITIKIFKMYVTQFFSLSAIELICLFLG